MSEIKGKQKCEQFNNETTKLSLALTSVNEAWRTLRDGIYNAAITVFGKSVKKNVDWFEENSLTLLLLVNEKRTQHFSPTKPVQAVQIGKICERHVGKCKQRRGNVSRATG